MVSCLESYFDTLMANSGASEIVLLNDQALLLVNDFSGPKSTSSDRREDRRDAATTPSFGPPSCPLRQDSNDDVATSVRTANDRKTQQREQQEREGNKIVALNEFYGEVAPGLRFLPMSNGASCSSQTETTRNNQSWNHKLPSIIGSPSSSPSPKSSEFFRDMVAGVLDDANVIGSSPLTSGNRNRSPPSSTMVDYIDEAAAVVGLASCKRDSRWESGTEPASL